MSRTYRRRRVMSVAAASVLAIAIGVALGLVIDRHGRDRTSYRGRAYLGGEVVSAAYVRIHYRHHLFATHHKIDGLPVYLNSRNLSEGDATVLFRRRADGTFKMYALQGGP